MGGGGLQSRDSREAGKKPGSCLGACWLSAINVQANSFVINGDFLRLRSKGTWAKAGWGALVGAGCEGAEGQWLSQISARPGKEG